MRHLACLVLVVLASCDSKRAAPKQEAKPVGSAAVPDAAVGSAGSAGSGSGSAEVPPKWASDPPEVLRDKINSVNAHVIVLKTVADFPEYRDVLKRVEKMPGVVAAEAFIFVELAIAKAGNEPVSVALKAVDPARVGKVLSSFESRMIFGRLDTLATGTPPSIIIGDDLARSLDVGLGDDVTISAPKAVDGAPPDINIWKGIKPTVFRVTGTFHFDFDEYDERLALAPLFAVQTMLGRGDQVMGIEMTVKDLGTSDKLADKIEAALGGPPYQAMDWYELNQQLFTTLFGARRP